MALHPAIENLKDDLVMAAMQNPHKPGSPEHDAYHGHLTRMSRPENMHHYLGRGVEEIISSATDASAQVTKVIASSHDERSYDQKVTYDQPESRYG